MKKIKFKNKKGEEFVALVDNDDYDWLSKYSWYAIGDDFRTTKYAYSAWYANGKRIINSMHRMVTKAPQGMEVDHLNGNGFDNRKCNLRVCTRSENLRNNWKKRAALTNDA